MTQEDIRAEIMSALKNHEKIRLAVMRGLLTACTNELVVKGRKPSDKLTEDEILALIRRGAKQRKESIEQFKAGNRADLVERETAELAILETLLPAEMPREEIEKIVRAKIAEYSSEKPKSGIIMSILMRDLKGKANGSTIKEVVDDLLK